MASGWIHGTGAKSAIAFDSRRGLCPEPVSRTNRGRDPWSRVCAGGAANVPGAERSSLRPPFAAAVAVSFRPQDRRDQPKFGERSDGLPDDLASPRVYIAAGHGRIGNDRRCVRASRTPRLPVVVLRCSRVLCRGLRLRRKGYCKSSQERVSCTHRCRRSNDGCPA